MTERRPTTLRDEVSMTWRTAWRLFLLTITPRRVSIWLLRRWGAIR